MTAARVANSTEKRPAGLAGRFSCWRPRLLGYIPR